MNKTLKSQAHQSMFFSDMVALTKPKITIMALLVALAGVLHAKSYSQPSLLSALFSLIAIGFLVSGSSALNMYIERVQDKFMTRTKDRPLPSGRLDSRWAIVLGVIFVVSASYLILVASNYLTLFLGLSSLFIYVWCYTPLKQKSWLSLLVGSVPGAMPVMLGYIAVSGAIDQKAVALFLWAFLWQVPHFLAISLFREREYTLAGFPVFSANYGKNATKKTILLTSWLLVSTTFLLYFSEVISIFGTIFALALGIWFLRVCHKGVWNHDCNNWARKAFKASLVYQSLLFLLLIAEAMF